MVVMNVPKRVSIKSPLIGGMDFLDLDCWLKYPEIPVLDFLDTLCKPSSFTEVSGLFSQCPSASHLM